MEVFTKGDIMHYVIEMIEKDVDDNTPASYVKGMIMALDRLLHSPGMKITQCIDCKYVKVCSPSLCDVDGRLIKMLNPDYCSAGEPGRMLTADEVKKLFKEKEKTDETN